MRFTIAARAAVLTVIVSAAPARAADPLPSWNDGPAKAAITDFVRRVTQQGGPDFVPPTERIAAWSIPHDPSFPSSRSRRATKGSGRHGSHAVRDFRLRCRIRQPIGDELSNACRRREDDVDGLSRFEALDHATRVIESHRASRRER